MPGANGSHCRIVIVTDAGVTPVLAVNRALMTISMLPLTYIAILMAIVTRRQADVINMVKQLTEQNNVTQMPATRNNQRQAVAITNNNSLNHADKPATSSNGGH